jgi:hypothetical protein
MALKGHALISISVDAADRRVWRRASVYIQSVDMPATSVYLPTLTSVYLPKNIEYYPVDTVDHYLWVVIVAFFAAFMAAFGIGYASDARRPDCKSGALSAKAHTRARARDAHCHPR